MAFNWLYTSWNDNEYILFLIVIILTLIIINFGLWKRKKDKFYDINTTPVQSTTTTTPILTATTTPIQSASTTTTMPVQSTTTTPVQIATTTMPQTTAYKAPIETNPANDIFITDADKEKWRKMWGQLDGNDETVGTTSNVVVQNDITQTNSTLYNQPASNTSTVDYNKIGNYATIDNLGKSLTDTLGGVNSNLGYTLLTEQLGTFTPNYNNPNTYDNTQFYKTGINPNTVDGVSAQGTGKLYHKLGNKDGTPIIMQKDFAGVANIFAPNIYIANPPLNSDGYPDISYSV